jgi:hypothetical protein
MPVPFSSSSIPRTRFDVKTAQASLERCDCLAEGGAKDMLWVEEEEEEDGFSI